MSGLILQGQLPLFYGAEAVLVLFTGIFAAMTREEGYTRDDSGGIQSLANREKVQKKRWELPHQLWKHDLSLIC